VSQLLTIHPKNPQHRLLQIAVDVLNKGGLVVYPTDTSYALGCHIGDKQALAKIIALRRLSKKHQFTIACRDLSELGAYARVDNSSYRLLKRTTPGPFTFILRATKDVPKRLVHQKTRTIGIRVPDNEIALSLLQLMGEPIMTSTLRLPEAEAPLQDPLAICDVLGKQVDLVLDGGIGELNQSTVVDLSGPQAEVIRQGKGVL